MHKWAVHVHGKVVVRGFVRTCLTTKEEVHHICTSAALCKGNNDDRFIELGGGVVKNRAVTAHTVRHQSQHSVPPKRKPLNQEAVVMLIIGIYKRLSNVQQVRRAAERTVKRLKEKLSRA